MHEQREANCAKYPPGFYPLVFFLCLKYMCICVCVNCVTRATLTLVTSTAWRATVVLAGERDGVALTVARDTFSI